MSSDAPEPNDSNRLVVELAENAEGRRIFIPRLPAPSGLDWNVSHRRLDVREKGNYFLTVVAGNGLTFATPAIVFTTPAMGISFLGQSSDTATIAITSDYGEERAKFDIVLQTGSGTEIIDPTILVEPPGGVPDPALEIPTLTVRVDLVDGLYVYVLKEADPNLSGVTSTLTAKVSNYGNYAVIFDASFPLENPGITFPDGKPDYITPSQPIGSNTVTLQIQVAKGQPWPKEVPLKIEKGKPPIPKDPNDPTILVEPPSGDE